MVLTDDDNSDVESVTPPSEWDIEPEAPPEIGVEYNSPPQSPSSRYKLFGAKNKIEIESQQPLSKLNKNVNRTWHDETETLSTAESTINATIRHWQKARLDSVPCSFMIAQEIGGKRSNVLIQGPCLTV